LRYYAANDRQSCSSAASNFGSVRNVTYDGALESQSLVPTQDNHSYWEYLPSLNLNLHPVSNINLRFGVARSITLPEYIDTAPSGILTIIDPNSRNYNPQLRPNFGTFGSTQLEPIAALATGAGFPLPLIQASTGNLDANLTYAINKHIELTASAVNITRETRKEYLGTPTALVNYYDRPVSIRWVAALASKSSSRAVPLAGFEARRAATRPHACRGSDCTASN
jgi:outer membrane receptor protein involved in Fe transport